MRASRLFLVSALVLVGAFAVPGTARAQHSVGAFLGREFDESDHWLLFGAEARMALPNSPVVINPRASYHSWGEGAKALQLDVNVLYDFKLANPGLIRPYLGVGGGLVHQSFGSDGGCGSDCSSSKLVGDFVAGFKLVTGNGDAAIVPFLNTEYSFAKQFTNTYQMTIGLIYTLKK